MQPSNQTGTFPSDICAQLETGFSLAGFLLQAHDKESAILAMMRVTSDWLGALGATFLPLNEWVQTIPSISYGESAFLKDDAWLHRLSEATTRHACRICESKQAGPACILQHDSPDANHIFCINLRCCGRDIGVVSFFFPYSFKISDDQHHFLAEAVRLVDLALAALSAHADELDATRSAISLLDLKTVLLDQGMNNKALLEQLEYKAVLDERTRLAREIHDGLAQTLAFLKLETTRILNHVSKEEYDVAARMLQSCNETISDAYMDARQAIDNLRQVPNERLSDWLEITAEEFGKFANVGVDTSNVHLTHVFPPGVKIQVIRIIQEALTNIRKHAQACSITIIAFEHEDEAVIEIHDNGIGFNPNTVEPTSQYGLRSMRERAESIDADIQISSASGFGTTVRLVVQIRDMDRQ